MKIIRHFKAIGLKNGKQHELRGNCPYELDRSAYHWFADSRYEHDPEFYVVFHDDTEEQYKL